jgi:hypothetical protein
MLHNIRLQRLSNVKDSNLMIQFVSYYEKKCYEYGPWFESLYNKLECLSLLA